MRSHETDVPERIVASVINAKSIRAGIFRELGSAMPIYAVLLSYVNSKMAATVTLRTISEATGKTKATVSSQLCSMRDNNIIKIIPGKPNKPNTYIIVEEY